MQMGMFCLSMYLNTLQHMHKAFCTRRVEKTQTVVKKPVSKPSVLSETGETCCCIFQEMLKNKAHKVHSYKVGGSQHKHNKWLK